MGEVQGIKEKSRMKKILILLLICVMNILPSFSADKIYMSYLSKIMNNKLSVYERVENCYALREYLAPYRTKGIDEFSGAQVGILSEAVYYKMFNLELHSGDIELKNLALNNINSEQTQLYMNSKTSEKESIRLLSQGFGYILKYATTDKTSGLNDTLHFIATLTNHPALRKTIVGLLNLTIRICGDNTAQAVIDELKNIEL